MTKRTFKQALQFRLVAPQYQCCANYPRGKRAVQNKPTVTPWLTLPNGYAPETLAAASQVLNR